MKISHSTKIQSHRPAVYFVYIDGKKHVPAGGELPLSLLAQAREDGFTAKPGSLATVRNGTEKIVLVGLGKKEEADNTTVRLGAAAVARHSVESNLPFVQFVLPEIPDRPSPAPMSEPLLPKRAVLTAQALVEGTVLGSYCFDAYKSQKPKQASLKELILVSATREAANAAVGGEVGRAVNFARELINRPPSDKRPTVLAAVARTLAGQGVSVRVFGKAELKRMGANALLAVNRGSAHPPALIHFRYRPKGKVNGSVVFVGKGVTFDSGGLSLKPADGMMTMKYDMAGAATVFALFQALPKLKPQMEVHGVAVLTENMPGPDAYKPGDVVKAMNGKTIEVLNTDAEGRVILADALVFASRLKVDAVIDVATLTGAASVALGKAYAALMSNAPALEKALRAAGERAGEKLWPLPLEKSYLDHIQSKVADFKNIGNPGEAGTIIGGLFLQQFVDDKPWAHVDMASVGWNGNGSLLAPPGATGALVRTFLAYVMETAESTRSRPAASLPNERERKTKSGGNR
jgi:leucyl aminopeptidase